MTSSGAPGTSVERYDKSTEKSENGPGNTMSPKKRTTHYDDLPVWMQAHHPYIKVGYRHQLNTLAACFCSLFYPHNELVNIWSHLLPALCYIVSLLAADYSVFHSGVTISTADTAVVQLYGAGTAACLLLSAIYHCTNSHSEWIAQHLLKLDYLGVTLSISVTNVSCTYFGLYSEPRLQAIYTTISLACAVVVLSAMLDPRSDGPKAALFRVIIFMALMASGFAPIVHRAITVGTTGLRDFPLMHIGWMCVCYFMGATFYVAQWPESCCSSTFDIWGASHQIFHTFIVMGQFIFFLGLREALLMHY